MGVVARNLGCMCGVEVFIADYTLFKPGVAGQRVPGFLELLLSANVCICMCVCPCPRGY